VTWKPVPLKALFRRRNETGRPDLPLLSVYRDLGVVLRAGRDDNFNRPAEDMTTYQVVHVGDLVLNKMKTWQGSLGISRYLGIVSPAYYVCRQVGEADGRFIHHLLRSRPLIAEYGARSKGIRPAQWDLPWDAFRDIKVNLPDVDTQRDIARFLDAETARMDALIQRRRRMIELLGEREQASLIETMGDWRAEVTRSLRQYRTRVLTGPFGTQLAADEYVDGGVPLINPTHIRRGRLIPESGVSVPEAVAERLSRHRLAAGDIVMGRKGDVGRAAVVPSESHGWLCGSDSIAIRTDPDRLLPRWLALVLHVDLYRQQLAAGSTGAMMANVNETTLSTLRIPDLTLEEQARAADAAATVVKRYEFLAGRGARQIELLVEHRHALVTAAVTGQLDLAKVAA
jgi:type I restriction enzyme, S subunit